VGCEGNQQARTPKSRSRQVSFFIDVEKKAKQRIGRSAVGDTQVKMSRLGVERSLNWKKQSICVLVKKIITERF
jgi:hypothetical protein